MKIAEELIETRVHGSVWESRMTDGGSKRVRVGGGRN